MIKSKNGKVTIKGTIAEIDADMICAIRAIRCFYHENIKEYCDGIIEDMIKHLYEVSLMSEEEIDNKDIVADFVKRMENKYFNE